MFRSASLVKGWNPASSADVPTHRNTTVSLIVTNAQLDYAGLRRLTIQVHTSMARAIQPFSTFDDGDTPCRHNRLRARGRHRLTFRRTSTRWPGR